MVKESLMQIKNILILHKKKIRIAIVTVAIIGAVSAGAHAMFQVRGIVTGVGDNSVIVANFFRTQTVSLAGTPVQALNIKVGDQIKIQKNIQGEIIYAKVLSAKNGEHKGKEHNQGRDSQKRIEHQKNQEQQQI